MALVRFGNGVSEIIGSIAGNTFARNRGGAYIRNRTKPINAPTVTQSAIRQRFAAIMQEFSGLTSGQIQSWNVLAESTTRKNKLGEDYTPSGVQMFMELNLNLSASNQARIANAPIAEPLTAPAINSLSVTGTAAGTALTVLSFSADLAKGTGSIIAEASLPFQQRQSSTSVKYRSVGSAVAPASGASLLAGYEDAYGEVGFIAGMSIWMRFRAVDDNGFAGPWLYEVVSISTAD